VTDFREGIQAEILPAIGLKEKVNEHKTNLETLARESRFELLASACVRHGIMNLLLGHHEADDYETVLLRKVTKNGVVNLGLQEHQQMPMTGLANYGVRCSGQPVDPRTFHFENGDNGIQGYEKGGIIMYRPLLKYKKNDLVQLLKDNNIPWIEDPSNQDVSLTPRNALRALDQSQMPLALQHKNVMKAANSANALYETYARIASHMYYKCQIKLDAYIGILYIRLPTWTAIVRNCEESSVKEPRIAAAHFFRMLADTVDPTTTSSLSHFYSLIDHIYPESAPDALHDSKFNWQVGSVHFKPLKIKPMLPWPNMGARTIFELHPEDYFAIFRTALPQGRVTFQGHDNRHFDIAPAPLNAHNHLFDIDESAIDHKQKNLFVRQDGSHSRTTTTTPGNDVESLLNVADAERVSINSVEFHDTSEAPFRFFDNRFWISIKNPTPFKLVLRTATLEDLNQLQTQMQMKLVSLTSPHSQVNVSALPKEQLYQLGASKMMIAKLVVPILVYKSAEYMHNQENNSARDHILAFPTLGVRVIKDCNSNGNSFPDWSKDISWTARYKDLNWNKDRPASVFIRPVTEVTRYAWNKLLLSPLSALPRERDILVPHLEYKLRSRDFRSTVNVTGNTESRKQVTSSRPASQEITSASQETLVMSDMFEKSVEIKRKMDPFKPEQTTQAHNTMKQQSDIEFALVARQVTTNKEHGNPDLIKLKGIGSARSKYEKESKAQLARRRDGTISAFWSGEISEIQTRMTHYWDHLEPDYVESWFDVQCTDQDHVLRTRVWIASDEFFVGLNLKNDELLLAEGSWSEANATPDLNPEGDTLSNLLFDKLVSIMETDALPSFSSTRLPPAPTTKQLLAIARAVHKRQKMQKHLRKITVQPSLGHSEHDSRAIRYATIGWQSSDASPVSRNSSSSRSEATEVLRRLANKSVVRPAFGSEFLAKPSTFDDISSLMRYPAIRHPPATFIHYEAKSRSVERRKAQRRTVASRQYPKSMVKMTNRRRPMTEVPDPIEANTKKIQRIGQAKSSKSVTGSRIRHGALPHRFLGPREASTSHPKPDTSNDERIVIRDQSAGLRQLPVVRKLPSSQSALNRSRPARHHQTFSVQNLSRITPIDQNRMKSPAAATKLPLVSKKLRHPAYQVSTDGLKHISHDFSELMGMEEDQTSVIPRASKSASDDFGAIIREKETNRLSSTSSGSVARRDMLTRASKTLGFSPDTDKDFNSLKRLAEEAKLPSFTRPRTFSPISFDARPARLDTFNARRNCTPRGPDWGPPPNKNWMPAPPLLPPKPVAPKIDLFDLDELSALIKQADSPSPKASTTRSFKK
jgi:hypothetical protein